MERLVVGIDETDSARVGDGDPAEVLADLARDADLLALGSSRLGTVSGAVLGAIAVRWIADAAVPVVVVPGPDGT